MKGTPQGVTTQVRDRGEPFTARAATRIWCEIPSVDNPYLAERHLCHGYDQMELLARRGVADTLYLLFRGELPTSSQSALLEAVMVALVNPGPRHPACRAVMNTAVSKTNPAHFLSIGASLLSGSHLGHGEVVASMRYLDTHIESDPATVARKSLAFSRAEDGDRRVAPGFGTRFGGIDPLANQIGAHLCRLLGAGKGLRWGNAFSSAIGSVGMGWLLPGVAGAAFHDLGFSPRAGGCLFQWMSLPGILAHGLEMAGQPLSAMPFIKNEDYVIEPR
jgi:citrate synthase